MDGLDLVTVECLHAGLMRGYAPPRMNFPGLIGGRRPNSVLLRVSRAMPRERGSAAVLMSGGLDSAVLAVDLVGDHDCVHPLYVRSGLRWEEAELKAALAFLAEVRAPGLESLVLLDEPTRDVYGSHWSTGGDDVPGSETPDEAVYLPGRNLLLTVKAAVWCRLRGVGSLAIGSLGSNPFPDSTSEFFQDLELLLSRAMNGGPRLIRPFDRLHKEEVIRRGKGLPLHLTLSCIQPIDGKHCGQCNKCSERRSGFRAAGVADHTRYAAEDRPRGRQGKVQSLP
jgi:7-cyano-7-deazaguanine synthase